MREHVKKFLKLQPNHSLRISTCYTSGMQKIATKVFIYASLVFGVIGILMILTSADNDNDSSDFNKLLQKLLFITVFIILPSFALSVAGKYLRTGK